MQSIYAFNKSDQQVIENQERFLLQSVDTMFDLFLANISLMLKLKEQAWDYFEKSKKKHLATSEDKEPNTKFVDNAIWQKIENNPALNELLEDQHINYWDDQPELLAYLWKKTRQSDIYKTYTSERSSDFNEDKEFFIQFFKEIIAPDDRLYDFLEDTKLTWLDDLPLVNTYFLKLFKKVKPNSGFIHFPTADKTQLEKEFGQSLLKKTLLNQGKLMEEYADKTPNWDKERIASIDSVLMIMAICEFLKFPSIPVKVTINEYLEIAKEYSTPKSSIFINGVLDKLSKDFKQAERLDKSGRGLM